MWKHTLAFLCLLLCPILQVSAENAIIIEFADLERYAGPASPRGQQIESKYQIIEADKRTALEWSNPAFSFESQKVAGAHESEFVLSKTFALPWSYLQGRKAWDLRLRAADFRRTADRRELLAQIRSEYAAIGLYQQQVQRFDQLRSVIVKAAEVARHRHQEGFISGTENHLVRMALLSLSSSRQTALEDLRHQEAEWGATLGLPSGAELQLADQPRFRRVSLASVMHFAAELERQPAVLSHLLAAEGLSRLASAEGQRAISGLDLAVGIKRIGSESGSVIGLSMSLPFLNSNRAAVRGLRAQEQIARSEADFTRSRVAIRLKALLQTIPESADILEPVAAGFAAESSVLPDLLLSYEEGFISLSELLNSIQIEVAGSMSYFDQLRGYYAAIFELEAITGHDLVNLSSEESRR